MWHAMDCAAGTGDISCALPTRRARLRSGDDSAGAGTGQITVRGFQASLSLIRLAHEEWEVLDLTWERVDRARGVILLDVTKSGKRREILLNSRADAILARRGSTVRAVVSCSVHALAGDDPPLRSPGARTPAQCGSPPRHYAARLRFSASFSARGPGPGGAALEVAVVVGAPGRSRTCDPRIRSPMLCPAELQARQALTIHERAHV